ncbi:DUF4843 domain-containing protein [Coprobacter sp.]
MRTKNIIFLKFISLLILVTGCREEIPEYSGVSGIYFAMSESKGGLDDSKLDYTDKTSVPFAVFDKEDSVLIVRAKILGEVTAHDREIIVEVIADESTAIQGEDYEPLQEKYYVKANDVYAQIPIHFYKKSSLKDNERILRIRLKESKDFNLPMSYWLAPNSSNKNGVDVIHHTISISDKWVKLPGFNEYFLGPYSEKKNRLICDLFNLTLLDFIEPMTTVKIRTLGVKFDQYLKEMEAKEQTVYEDYRDSNGNLVKMTAGEGINY